MKTCIILVALMLSQFAVAQEPALPANIEALAKEIQGKSPEEVHSTIVRRLGSSTRTAGSGAQIDLWDADGGVLVFHPTMGVTFQLGGKSTRLIKTNNPAALCLFGNFEMTTQPEPPYDMRYWLGNVTISPDGYSFVDSKQFPDHRTKQKENFFILHPTGRVHVHYAFGVRPEARLEELPDNAIVATLTFTARDGTSRKVYDIVTNRTSMSLGFSGKDMPFRLKRSWANFWQ